MANANVLPLRFSGFVDAVDGYLGELHELAGAKRKNAEELAKAIDQKAFALAEDPQHRLAPPEYRGEVPYLDFAPMDNVLARLKKSAKTYDDLYAKVAGGAAKLDANQRKQLNSLLQGMEQTLTDQSGLPARDWYKHFIYAPGLLTGYGVKTLPAIREAIDDDRWDEANRYIEVTAKVIGAYCDRLDRATQVLKGG
jgi:N-acetylated-alpha-linked acidic dipeptidase